MSEKPADAPTLDDAALASLRAQVARGVAELAFPYERELFDIWQALHQGDLPPMTVPEDWRDEIVVHVCHALQITPAEWYGLNRPPRQDWFAQALAGLAPGRPNPAPPTQASTSPPPPAPPQWSKPASISYWARAFGIGRHTMAQRPRNCEVSCQQIGKLWMVALASLPEKERRKHLP
jgi:hypothetical protein